MLHPFFKSLARFNAWANTRLYEVCALLPDAEYKRDRKAFFGSIHRTLNHLLVVDQLWRGRIEGWKPSIASLDQQLHAEFEPLRLARVAEDGAIVRMVDGLEPARLLRSVKYSFVDGTPAETPLDTLLITLFNHQTHHRGQVHTLLSQAGVKPPPLDIILWHQETARP